jgi:Mg2+ and Co2+ transporter CorA
MNTIMTILTLFSAFLLPLTLITSFYWMNINLPFQKESSHIYIMLIVAIFIMITFYIYFKKKWKF